MTHSASSTSGAGSSFSAAALRAWLYRYGREGTRDRIVLAAGYAQASSEELRSSFRAAERFAVPCFPVKGKDLLGLGLAGLSAGKALGALLQRLEDWWIAEDFAPSRSACLSRARALWQSRADAE